MGQRGLVIRLLGDLAVVRDGSPLELPASKKTRALLGYLATMGGPHTREKLCELFWEGPDDPRAQLRWSLTKIRPLIDDARATRLVGNRVRRRWTSWRSALRSRAVSRRQASSR